MSLENSTAAIHKDDDCSDVEEIDQSFGELSVDDIDFWSSRFISQYHSNSTYDEEVDSDIEQDTISNFKFDLLLERVLKNDPQEELRSWIESPDSEVPHVDFDELLDVILTGSDNQVERCIKTVESPQLDEESGLSTILATPDIMTPSLLAVNGEVGIFTQLLLLD
ncbi:hypothetical protein K7432_009008 [Basidiobolus ranarum]|uniref:Uncharacterized protein n=1 Tax=Basidiobolus ranarum TaxID=34480 RepID=A0ABR2WQX4_9FUNG